LKDKHIGQVVFDEFSLAYLVPKSIEFMIEHFPEKQGYWEVAFSGGKDSIVLYDIVKKSGLPHHVHYVNTTIDPPELVRFIKEKYPEVEILHAPPFFQMWKKKGIQPFMFARWCCDTQKKNVAPHIPTLCGVRAEESFNRKKRGAIIKQSYYPIFDWPTEEIWIYIHKNKLEYPSLYDEGFHRIGCIMCPFIYGSDKQVGRNINRWPKHYAAMKRFFFKWQNRNPEHSHFTNDELEIMYDNYIHGRKIIPVDAARKNEGGTE